MKRLSLRHQRDCFHKGFFFSTKSLEKEIQWFYLIIQRENSELLYVQLEWRPPTPTQSINHFLEYTPSSEGSPGRFESGYSWFLSALDFLCHSTQPPCWQKRASRVAIVILSCWAPRYLEGNQMRTRSREQDGVNVRQPKVICALCLEMFWYAEERMPGNTNQSPLWVQFNVWVFK